MSQDKYYKHNSKFVLYHVFDDHLIINKLTQKDSSATPPFLKVEDGWNCRSPLVCVPLASTTDSFLGWVVCFLAITTFSWWFSFFPSRNLPFFRSYMLHHTIVLMDRVGIRLSRPPSHLLILFVFSMLILWVSI